MKHMIDKGHVKPSRLQSEGYGEDRPLVVPEKTEADREKNRRVEFRITGINKGGEETTTEEDASGKETKSTKSIDKDGKVDSVKPAAKPEVKPAPKDDSSDDATDDDLPPAPAPKKEEAKKPEPKRAEPAKPAPKVEPKKAAPKKDDDDDMPDGEQ
jgi:hypothetical protein